MIRPRSAPAKKSRLIALMALGACFKVAGVGRSAVQGLDSAETQSRYAVNPCATGTARISGS